MRQLLLTFWNWCNFFLFVAGLLQKRQEEFISVPDCLLTRGTGGETMGVDMKGPGPEVEVVPLLIRRSRRSIRTSRRQFLCHFPWFSTSSSTVGTVVKFNGCPASRKAPTIVTKLAYASFFSTKFLLLEGQTKSSLDTCWHITHLDQSMVPGQEIETCT